MEDTAAKPSILKRLLAFVVLALAAVLLLKLVISVISGFATVIVIVFCLVAVVWALRIL